MLKFNYLNKRTFKGALIQIIKLVKLMFFFSKNNLGNLEKLDFMVLKHFLLNRMLTKGFRNASLNYNFRTGDILYLNIIRLEKKFKSLHFKPTGQRGGW